MVGGGRGTKNQLLFSDWIGRKQEIARIVNHEIESRWG